MSFKIPSADEFIKRLNDLDEKTFDSIYERLIYDIETDKINEALDVFSKSLVKKSTIFKLNPSISNSSDKSIGNVSLSDSYIHHSSQEDINPLLKGKKINTKNLINSEFVSSGEEVA
ncbi:MULTISPECIES: hypothetical protein [Lactobacillus]|uniref:hypothetical protein n=1 Tax=Lactobacillus TaxID=1578 RepID=UPI0011DC7AE6|nr:MULTISPECIES: hypothetical protein [Lactobacillus]MCR1903338.1 hypothetical protein [Lactobacillus taiwanensis]